MTRRGVFVAAGVSVAACALVALAAGASYAYLRRSLPQLRGTVSVSGVSGPVDIIRDEDGITHVFAATTLDAFYGLGYAHAQDRLWQMEYQRRQGHASQSAWNTLPARAKSELTAYIAGVNMFISTHHGSRLPMEFILRRSEPEPWTGPDVLVPLKTLASGSNGSASRFETVRHDLLQAVGPERTADLLASTPPSTSGLRAASSWVIDGTATASGKPLLASDLQTDALIPSVWYLAHLSAGDLDVIGATMPGTPAVVVGRNRNIAWGAANVEDDHEPDDTMVVAFLRLNEARNWADFVGALRGVALPAREFLYADITGHIGRFTARSNLLDPPEHVIVSANQPFVVTRVAKMLETKPKPTVDDVADIQSDRHSLHAEALMPLLYTRAFPADGRDDRALTILRQWDFNARGDAAAPAVFEAWYDRLLDTIAGDELGPSLIARYRDLDDSASFARFVTNTLQTNDNPWCDDVRTPAKETCDDAVMAALHAGLDRLEAELGTDMRAWRWDRVHRVVFRHRTLDDAPLLGRWLRRTAPNGGDWGTVNAAPVFTRAPFEQRFLPGYRQIVDLSDRNDSRLIDALGQSSHVLSPRYADGLQNWTAGHLRKMRMDRVDAERNAIGHLRLEPALPNH